MKKLSEKEKILISLCTKKMKIRKIKKILKKYCGYFFKDLERYACLGSCKLKVGDVIGACSGSNERINRLQIETYKGVILGIIVYTEQGSCGGWMDYLYCVSDIPYTIEKCVSGWERYGKYLLKVGNENKDERLIKKGSMILDLLSTNNLLDGYGVINKEHAWLGKGEYAEAD